MIGNLLDVPQDEREPLRDWSLAILGALEPVISPEVFARGNKAVKDFLAYLEGLVARRRAKPGNPDRDVLTRLIQGEDNGERLTEKELLHNCIFLLNAGHETTTNLIGNGLVALSDHAGEKQRLIENPALIKTAVEEMLRFESSNQLGNRMTVEPVELGGIAMPAGTPVTLCIGAANRDPAQFADPERLDIGRTPNRHLAFGTGAHQCAGMALARLEGAIAISRFLARFPDYALDRRAGARRPGALPRIFERAVRGRLNETLIAGGIEAGKIAVPFRIFHPAKALAVLDHGRPATLAPGGLRRFIGLLLFRCPLQDLDGRTTADSEIGLLTGKQRTAGGDGRGLGDLVQPAPPGGLGGSRRVAVIHRELRGRGRDRSDDDRDRDEDAHGHCLLK